MKRTAEFGTVTIDIQRLRKGVTRIRVVKWKHWGGKNLGSFKRKIWAVVCFFSKQMKPEGSYVLVLRFRVSEASTGCSHLRIIWEGCGTVCWKRE